MCNHNIEKYVAIPGTHLDNLGSNFRWWHTKSLAMMSGCGLTLAWFWPNFQQISRKWKATSENFVEVILSLQYCNHKIEKCVPVPGTQLDKLDMIWRVSHQYLGLLQICLDEPVQILLVRTGLNIIWTGREGGAAGASQSLGKTWKGTE